MFLKNVTQNVVIIAGVRLAPGDVAEFPDEKRFDPYFMAAVKAARLREDAGPARVAEPEPEPAPAPAAPVKRSRKA